MEVCVLAPVWRAREEANVLALYNLFTHAEFTMSPPLFNDAAIDRARSRGATYFLEQTSADVALWIDSDIDFHDADALTICQQAMDPATSIVTGVYPTRSASQAIPASRMLRDHVYTFSDDPTPQPILWAAGGFVAVHRRVYERMSAYPGMGLLHEDSPVLRMRPFYLPMAGRDEDGNAIYLSEDWAFCERARQIGYPSFANCAVDLAHVGTYRYGIKNLFTAPQIARPIRFTRRADGNLVERPG